MTLQDMKRQSVLTESKYSIFDMMMEEQVSVLQNQVLELQKAVLSLSTGSIQSSRKLDYFYGETAMADGQLSAGDTAWMLAATALVLFMTIPGLALYYGGMV